MKNIIYPLLLIVAIWSSCKTTGKQGSNAVTTVDIDTIEVLDEKIGTQPIYNPSYTRRNDLLHTSLEVSFDWTKQHLLGKAELTFKPVFYMTDSLELDAKGFDILKVEMKGQNGQTPLQYKYDGQKMRVKLDRAYTRNEQYIVFIQYVAKPNELKTQGSAAITDAKGLYFINPLKEDPNKPQQIWTQGETESSSCWFPTVDKPNERTTQEIKITVEDKFKSLSNGIMKSSTKNADGTRTDYFVMDKPHAPYLFMMAVGEFAVVKDTWNGMPLEYWVEPKYEAYAKQIYNHTPEMLTFFSEKMGVKYPWSKYSQIIVRDYVSGAMENTTAVIFGDFCQKTDRQLEDDNNDGIVAHEMFHHWFGDLVTCESWSNLPMNESFANYSEYLWTEHKYSKDQADMLRQGEIKGYMGSAKNGGHHNLIWFDYDDKEDMFDGHSYNKGGAILHMLRSYVGDDAFFAALKLYLEKNAYSDVESHELRLAFEDVTGEDLSWFFNQWFYGKGHPSIEIDYAYDETKKQSQVVIKQAHDIKEFPLYKIPLAVDVYENGAKAVRHNVWLKNKIDTFYFKVSRKPDLINVDAKKTLLCEKKDRHTQEDYAYMFYYGKEYLDRHEALDGLKGSLASSSKAQKVYSDALNDPFWGIRLKAIKGMKAGLNNAKLIEMASSDPNNDVKEAAFDKLGELKEMGAQKAAINALTNERSYKVIAGALAYLAESSPAEASKHLSALENTDNESIAMTVADIYGESGDVSKLAFFEKAIERFESFTQMGIIANYATLLTSGNDIMIRNGVDRLKKIAMDKNKSMFGRYGATNGIKAIQNFYNSKSNKDKVNEMQDIIETIKANEKDPNLQQYYKGF